MSEFPTITLSACEDDDDDDDDEAIGVQRDSVMEVGEVGVLQKRFRNAHHCKIIALFLLPSHNIELGMKYSDGSLFIHG